MRVATETGESIRSANATHTGTTVVLSGALGLVGQLRFWPTDSRGCGDSPPARYKKATCEESNNSNRSTAHRVLSRTELRQSWLCFFHLSKSPKSVPWSNDVARGVSRLYRGVRRRVSSFPAGNLERLTILLTIARSSSCRRPPVAFNGARTRDMGSRSPALDRLNQPAAVAVITVSSLAP